jgi:translation initiation factor 1A
MPVKKKKSKNSKSFMNNVEKTRDLEFKQENEEYGKVMSILGDRKIKVLLVDGRELLGVIPGRLRKKVWISVDDVVLLSCRSFQTDKVDILYKYEKGEISKLISYLEIPDIFERPSSMLSDIVDNKNTSFSFETNDDDVNTDGIDFKDI